MKSDAAWSLYNVRGRIVVVRKKMSSRQDLMSSSKKNGSGALAFTDFVFGFGFRPLANCDSGVIAKQ
jgi:hypothetical protein